MQPCRLGPRAMEHRAINIVVPIETRESRFRVFRARPCHCRHTNHVNFFGIKIRVLLVDARLTLTRGSADSTATNLLMQALVSNSIHSSLSFSGFGVIHSQSVEDGFRAVDRRFFVPTVRPRKGSWLGDLTCGHNSSFLVLMLIEPSKHRSFGPAIEGRKHSHFGSPYLWQCFGGARAVAEYSSLFPQHRVGHGVLDVHCC